MRLFVSVDLPDALTDDVAAVQDGLPNAGGLQFTNPSQAHLTLKFLGEADSGRLDEIEAAVSEAVDDAGVSSFEATVGGLGAFPSEEYIRVVWLGFEAGGQELTRLHEAIEERTVALGFEAEDHEFTPHVTLARMEHAGGKELVQRALRERSPTVSSWTIEAVRLTESELGPDGPEYSTVAEFPLG